jgi:hypothetical protein
MTHAISTGICSELMLSQTSSAIRSAYITGLQQVYNRFVLFMLCMYFKLLIKQFLIDNNIKCISGKSENINLTEFA